MNGVNAAAAATSKPNPLVPTCLEFMSSLQNSVRNQVLRTTFACRSQRLNSPRTGVKFRARPQEKRHTLRHRRKDSGVKLRGGQWVRTAMVLAAALGVAAPTWADELTVGEAKAADPDPAYVPSYQTPRGIASNGSDWLVLSGLNGELPLTAARVTANGTVLDKPGFLVSGSSGAVYGAGVSFDGTDYIVAWAEADAGAASPARIMLRHVANDTTLADPVEVALLEPAPGYFPFVSVASSPNGDLVVWTEVDTFGDPGSVHWVLVQNNQVVAADSMDFDASFEELDAAASGDHWLVAVRTSEQEVRGFRVEPDGTATETTSMLLSGATLQAASPSIAPSPGGWVVTWLEKSYPSAAETLRAVQIDPVEGVTAAKSVMDGLRDYRAKVAATSKGFVVVGYDYDMLDRQYVYVRFLNSDLTPATGKLQYVGEPLFLEAGDFISWGGQSLLVSWSDDGYVQKHESTFAKRLSACGKVLDEQPIVVATKLSDQFHPSAARGPGAWLETWEDNRAEANAYSDEAWGIYAQLLTDAGEPLTQRPLHLPTYSGEARNPEVAGSPCGWFIVWSQGGYSLLGARVTPDGKLIDSMPLTLGKAEYGAHLKFDGAYWVVAWADFYSQNHGTPTILRLNASGQPVDAGPITVWDVNDARAGSVDVDLDSSGYAVSWVSSSGGVLMRHVDLSGVPVEAQPVELVAGDISVGTAAVECRDGDGWMFWSSDNGATFRSLGGAGPDQGVGSGYSFDVTAVGQQALAVWQDPASWQESPIEHVGLAALKGPLESKYDFDATEMSDTRVAARGNFAGLVTTRVAHEIGGGWSSRVEARVVDITLSQGGASGDIVAGVDCPVPPVVDGSGGAGGNAGSAGEAGSSAEDCYSNVAGSGAGGEGGTPSVGSGGSASNNGGDGGTTDEPDSGSAGVSNEPDAPDSGIATGGTSTGGTSASSGGETSAVGDAKAAHGREAAGCVCDLARGGGGTTSASWFALAALGAFSARRRRR